MYTYLHVYMYSSIRNASLLNVSPKCKYLRTDACKEIHTYIYICRETQKPIQDGAHINILIYIHMVRHTHWHSYV